MSRKFTDLMFTDAVKAAQSRNGSREAGERMAASRMADDRLSPAEAAFIAERDHFYMGTVNEEGWPYVQYRGGPPGFLKVLDERTLAFADFSGNRQYLSVGNLGANDRATLFLIDQANRRRVKLFGRTEIHGAEERPDLVEAVADPGYRARIERVVVLHLEAFDWNCPQHITPRFTAEEWEARQKGDVGGGTGS